jgi:ATP-dependent Clp protease ATP-binding subunit ClpC
MDGRAFGPGDEEESNSKVKKNITKSETPNLDQFGKDLTDIAMKGGLDPVVGRESEIYNLIQIINKRRKNGPVLVGEPGIGKCFHIDTQVVMRNDLTGEVMEISVNDFLNSIPKT